MMDMIHYLLDAAEAGVPNDQLPSVRSLPALLHGSEHSLNTFFL